MLSKESLEYKERIINLEKYILDKPYGTTLNFDELNEFIGEDLKDEYGKIRFKAIIRKVKNKLYKRGYVLRSIKGIGYYILKPNQVAGYTYRTYIIKPLNSLYKAQLILESTEKNKLKLDEKQKHYKTEELNQSLIYASEMFINDEKFKELKED